MPEDYGEAMQYRRAPMEEKSVKEITEDDIRVAVLGTIVDIDGDEIVVDDGEGSIEVIFPEGRPETAEGDLVRVIGRVRSGDVLHLEGEAVQDMDGLNVKLYKSLKNG